jgi:hypothetical protein
MDARRRELLFLALTPLALTLLAVPGVGKWLFPLLAPLAVWPLFASAVRGGDYRRALIAGLAWAVLLSASVIALTQLAPGFAAATIVRGEPYRQEMFTWISTGVGPENDPRQFLPSHAGHLALFAALSLVSGGYLGLVLGAGLTSYMSFFVGSFALAADAPLLGALVAWVPWSVVRVVAFVALGTILAKPLLTRRRDAIGRREWSWIGAALVGIVLDVLLKTLLAPSYGLFLRGWLD